MKKILSLAAMVCACVLMFTSCSVSPKEGIKAIADMTNSICPMEQADGVTMTQVALEGDNLIYTISVDENVLASMDVDAAKASIISALQGEENKDLVSLLKSANVNIVYNYMGAESEEGFTITISPNEL